MAQTSRYNEISPCVLLYACPRLDSINTDKLQMSFNIKQPPPSEINELFGFSITSGDFLL